MATAATLFPIDAEQPTKAKLEGIFHTLQFILAGNATFTLVSKATGVRFTYKVRKADPKPGEKTVTYFVNLLTGSDNENDFTYMGILTDRTSEKLLFKRTAKSAVLPGAPSFKAFDWFWQYVTLKGAVPSTVEVWHEGRCGRCGRKLTVPSSIAAGIGPDCAEKGF